MWEEGKQKHWHACSGKIELLLDVIDWLKISSNWNLHANPPDFQDSTGTHYSPVRTLLSQPTAKKAIFANINSQHQITAHLPARHAAQQPIEAFERKNWGCKDSAFVVAPLFCPMISFAVQGPTERICNL